MSEAVFAHWEITRTKNAGQKPNPHGGQLDKWYCGLKNLDGGDSCDDAYWQRKAPSEVKVGDTVYGKIEQGDYGWRFYLEPEPDGPQTSSRGSSEARSGSKRSWQPEHERDPQRAARILRQHSQDVAVQFLIAQHKDDGGPLTLDAVFKVADLLDEDVRKAGQASSQAEGSHASPEAAAAPSTGGSPRPDQAPADEQQWAEHRLEGGLDSAGVTDPDERQWLIKAWREMPPKDGLNSEERRNIAITSITSQDLESQSSALKRLRELAGPMLDSFRSDEVVF